MFRVRYVAFTVALAATFPLQAQSATQAGAPTQSLTDLLLKQAQTALDAFDRPNAEKFARQILEQMTTSTTAQKEKARINEVILSISRQRRGAEAGGDSRGCAPGCRRWSPVR